MKCKSCGKKFDEEDGFSNNNGSSIYCSQSCLNREVTKGFETVSNIYLGVVVVGCGWAYVQYCEKGDWWLFPVVLGIIFLGRGGLKWAKGKECGSSQIKFWLGILGCGVAIIAMIRQLIGF